MSRRLDDGLSNELNLGQGLCGLFYYVVEMQEGDKPKVSG